MCNVQPHPIGESMESQIGVFKEVVSAYFIKTIKICRLNRLFFSADGSVIFQKICIYLSKPKIHEERVLTKLLTYYNQHWNWFPTCLSVKFSFSFIKYTSFSTSFWLFFRMTINQIYDRTFEYTLLCIPNFIIVLYIKKNFYLK